MIEQENTVLESMEKVVDKLSEKHQAYLVGFADGVAAGLESKDSEGFDIIARKGKGV